MHDRGVFVRNYTYRRRRRSRRHRERGQRRAEEAGCARARARDLLIIIADWRKEKKRAQRLLKKAAHLFF